MYITTPKQYLLIRRQGGISSKKKLSFKDDFNISFKALMFNDDDDRGTAFSVGFHQDRDDYINISRTTVSTTPDTWDLDLNLSAGIAGAKNSFELNQKKI